jgi:ATP-dependent DNA helicase RecG
MENPAYTYLEIAERLSLSRKTIAQRIKALKDKQVIQREGGKAKGQWVISIPTEGD